MHQAPNGVGQTSLQNHCFKKISDKNKEKFLFTILKTVKFCKFIILQERWNENWDICKFLKVENCFNVASGSREGWPDKFGGNFSPGWCWFATFLNLVMPETKQQIWLVSFPCAMCGLLAEKACQFYKVNVFYDTR